MLDPIMYDKRVPEGAKILWLILRDEQKKETEKTGNPEPAIKYDMLAALMGINRNTIDYYMRHLVPLGYIRRGKRLSHGIYLETITHPEK